MSDIAVLVDHLSKRFRKGQLHDSLRDLIPGVTSRMFGGRFSRSCDQREFWALQDVSFEVGRGEAFGIIGPNGAGKSTILKILSRLMRPTRGSIEIDGRFSALIELGAGFHGDLTGRENIYLYGTILGMTQREITAKFDEIVDFAGLAEFIDTPVKRYSSGMYTRLGFSVAAHVDPDVLLVDEILSVGDALFRQKCIQHMRGIIRDGATVVFVSHNLKTVAEFCRRSLLLNHGRAVAVGSTADVITRYMALLRQHRSASKDRPIVIASVRVRDASGPCHKFKAGQKAWIDVEVVAHQYVAKSTVVIYLRDSNASLLFVTSAERLHHANFTLDCGETFYCTFELNLNLGPGVFDVSVNLFRYDSEEWYDSWEAAETIYIWSDEDSAGPVNCFPKVVRHEIGALGFSSDPKDNSPETHGRRKPEPRGLVRADDPL
jgi:lipopolysaccharide transport system ATP-binding protein